MVECSPATRAARVRFPANAIFWHVLYTKHENTARLEDLQLSEWSVRWCKNTISKLPWQHGLDTSESSSSTNVVCNVRLNQYRKRNKSRDDLEEFTR